MDPNYSEFEKILVKKLETSINVEPDRYNAMNAEDRKEYMKQKHREKVDEEKKRRYFFAMRKRNTDTDSSIVVTSKAGCLYL